MLCSAAAIGQVQNTMQRRLQRVSEPRETITSVAAATDTVTPDTSMIRLAGFDKTLTATREAFFVTNRMAGTIKELRIRISYHDMRGRQLHEATHTLTTDIPAGATRQLTIPAWDRQHSFYYHRSVRPRRQATPFDVKCTIEMAAVTLNQ